MSKIKKIIIFIIMLLMVFTVNCYAGDISCNSIETSAGNFKKAGENRVNNIISDPNNQNLVSDITKPIVTIVQMLTTAGILIIGILIVILGIQWVMAKPSPEAQAKLKKQLVGLAVAAGVLVGAHTIWTIIVTIMDGIDG